jgi:CRISPR type III-B/RAMP module-associated protein Cmr5
MPQNLEQIRARNALSFAQKVREGKVSASGKEGGEALKKIPAMLMANGLLATLAFSVERKKDEQKTEVYRNPGYRAILGAVAEHLRDRSIGIVPDPVLDAEKLLDHLSNADTKTLQVATAEALAWLGYARRFVTPPDEQSGRTGSRQ